MQQVNYQTVKLSRGKHTSPEHGACVMELASMLAGESFSDHPHSVSPAIASFLRAYNDLLDDRRRQDLYEYAARTVGTAACQAVEDARADRLVAWGDEMRSQRSRWSLVGGLRRQSAVGYARRRDPEAAGRYAIRAIRRLSDDTHATVLSLIDELIGIGRGSAPALTPAPDAPSRQPQPLRSLI